MPCAVADTPRRPCCSLSVAAGCTSRGADDPGAAQTNHPRRSGRAMTSGAAHRDSSILQGSDSSGRQSTEQQQYQRRHRHRPSSSLSTACIEADPPALHCKPRACISRHEATNDTSAASVVSELKPTKYHHRREYEHMRKLSGLSKTLGLSSLHPSSSSTDRPSSSSDAANPPATPLLRSNTAPLPKLSPSQKRRPPASHSSYGIETSNGPPPSYSTQQTLSQQEKVVWPQERGRTSRTTVPTSGVSYTTTHSTESSSRPTSVPANRDPDPPHQRISVYSTGASSSTTSRTIPTSAHDLTNFKATTIPALQRREPASTTHAQQLVPDLQK